MALAIIIMGLMLLWFFRALYLKIAFPYEGRHHLNRIKEVPVTYHPSDSAWVPVSVKNRAWWNARMTRLEAAKILTIPVKDLLDRSATKIRLRQEALAWMARDYRWMEIPLEEWPVAWLSSDLIKSVQIAGSDLPSRAIAIVDTFKPFHNTVRERLAA